MGSEGYHSRNQPRLWVAWCVAAPYTTRLASTHPDTYSTTSDSNYNGDWADLIRFRYGLDSYNATKSIDFWTDPNMIEGYKLILNKFLKRTNTINGIVYGSDDTLGMIESGNELK